VWPVAAAGEQIDRASWLLWIRLSVGRSVVLLARLLEGRLSSSIEEMFYIGTNTVYSGRHPATLP
jgi:hypothetical protein